MSTQYQRSGNTSGAQTPKSPYRKSEFPFTYDPNRSASSGKQANTPFAPNTLTTKTLAQQSTHTTPLSQQTRRARVSSPLQMHYGSQDQTNSASPQHPPRTPNRNTQILPPRPVPRKEPLKGSVDTPAKRNDDSLLDTIRRLDEQSIQFGDGQNSDLARQNAIGPKQYSNTPISNRINFEFNHQPHSKIGYQTLNLEPQPTMIESFYQTAPVQPPPQRLHTSRSTSNLPSMPPPVVQTTPPRYHKSPHRSHSQDHRDHTLSGKKHPSFEPPIYILPDESMRDYIERIKGIRHNFNENVYRQPAGLVQGSQQPVQPCGTSVMKVEPVVMPQQENHYQSYTNYSLQEQIPASPTKPLVPPLDIGAIKFNNVPEEDEAVPYSASQPSLKLNPSVATDVTTPRYEQQLINDLERRNIGATTPNDQSAINPFHPGHVDPNIGPDGEPIFAPNSQTTQPTYANLRETPKFYKPGYPDQNMGYQSTQPATVIYNRRPPQLLDIPQSDGIPISVPESPRNDNFLTPPTQQQPQFFASTPIARQSNTALPPLPVSQLAQPTQQPTTFFDPWPRRQQATSFPLAPPPPSPTLPPANTDRGVPSATAAPSIPLTTTTTIHHPAVQTLPPPISIPAVTTITTNTTTTTTRRADAGLPGRVEVHGTTLPPQFVSQIQPAPPVSLHLLANAPSSVQPISPPTLQRSHSAGYNVYRHTWESNDGRGDRPPILISAGNGPQIGLPQAQPAQAQLLQPPQSDLLKIITQLRTENSELQKQISISQATTQDASAEFQRKELALCSELTKWRHEVETCNKTIVTIQKDSDQFKLTISNLQSSLDYHKDKLSQLEKESSKDKEVIQHQAFKIQLLTNDISKLKEAETELSKLKVTLDSEFAKNKRLENELNRLQNIEGEVAKLKMLETEIVKLRVSEQQHLHSFKELEIKFNDLKKVEQENVRMKIMENDYWKLKQQSQDYLRLKAEETKMIDERGRLRYLEEEVAKLRVTQQEYDKLRHTVFIHQPPTIVQPQSSITMSQMQFNLKQDLASVTEQQNRMITMLAQAIRSSEGMPVHEILSNQRELSSRLKNVQDLFGENKRIDDLKGIRESLEREIEHLKSQFDNSRRDYGSIRDSKPNYRPSSKELEGTERRGEGAVYSSVGARDSSFKPILDNQDKKTTERFHLNSIAEEPRIDQPSANQKFNEADDHKNKNILTDIDVKPDQPQKQAPTHDINSALRVLKTTVINQNHKMDYDISPGPTKTADAALKFFDEDSNRQPNTDKFNIIPNLVGNVAINKQSSARKHQRSTSGRPLETIEARGDDSEHDSKDGANVSPSNKQFEAFGGPKVLPPAPVPAPMVMTKVKAGEIKTETKIVSSDIAEIGQQPKMPPQSPSKPTAQIRDPSPGSPSKSPVEVLADKLTKYKEQLDKVVRENETLAEQIQKKDIKVKELLDTLSKMNKPKLSKYAMTDLPLLDILSSPPKNPDRKNSEATVPQSPAIKFVPVSINADKEKKPMDQSSKPKQTVVEYKTFEYMGDRPSLTHVNFNLISLKGNNSGGSRSQESGTATPLLPHNSIHAPPPPAQSKMEKLEYVGAPATLADPATIAAMTALAEYVSYTPTDVVPADNPNMLKDTQLEEKKKQAMSQALSSNLKKFVTEPAPSSNPFAKKKDSPTNAVTKQRDLGSFGGGGINNSFKPDQIPPINASPSSQTDRSKKDAFVVKDSPRGAESADGNHEAHVLFSSELKNKQVFYTNPLSTPSLTPGGHSPLTGNTTPSKLATPTANPNLPPAQSTLALLLAAKEKEIGDLKLKLQSLEFKLEKVLTENEKLKKLLYQNESDKEKLAKQIAIEEEEVRQSCKKLGVLVTEIKRSCGDRFQNNPGQINLFEDGGEGDNFVSPNMIQVTEEQLPNTRLKRSSSASKHATSRERNSPSPTPANFLSRGHQHMPSCPVKSHQQQYNTSFGTTPLKQQPQQTEDDEADSNYNISGLSSDLRNLTIEQLKQRIIQLKREKEDILRKYSMLKEADSKKRRILAENLGLLSGTIKEVTGTYHLTLHSNTQLA